MTIRHMTYLSYTSSQVTPHQVLIPLKLGLYNDQSKVGLGIHIARHFLDFLDLLLDALVYALEQAVDRPTIRRKGLSVSNHEGSGDGVAYSSSSGEDLSATQARVNACKSRVSSGMESNVGSTSRNMSSMSIASGSLLGICLVEEIRVLRYSAQLLIYLVALSLYLRILL